MKLKERDNRPKYLFRLGDIADLHYHGQIISGAVVVEARETSTKALKAGVVATQTCKVVVSPRELDLYSSLRRYIARKTMDPGVTIQGYEVFNTRMVHTGRVPDEWLASISSRDISNIRFEAILDD